MTNYLEVSKRVRHSRNHVRMVVEKSLEQIEPAVFSGARAGSPSWLGHSGSSGKKQHEAYEQFKNWVFVCANYIARKIASQPILAGESIGASANPERAARRIEKDALPSCIKNAAPGAEIKVIENHAALDAFERPNYLQDSFQFRYMSALNLLITGEAYWILSESEEGELELWALPTHWISVSHRDGPYTAFWLKPPGVPGEGIPLDPSAVARSYLPNPWTLTGVWSPLHAILRPAKVDDHIVLQQEKAFGKVHPSIIVTMGERRGPDGKPTGKRPTLTGAQRRQMVRSIKGVWSDVSNYGDPAIVDGMIESIHKLDSQPREMDWTNSSQINKSRIMQAYGVNPIVVGEIVGANRAQAVTAEKSVCSNTVNPLISIFSSTMTASVGPLYEDPQRLLLWIQPCEPIDTELKDKRWLGGHKQGVIDRDEVRAELFGLPPTDPDHRSAMLGTHTGWEQARKTIVSYSMGEMERASAISMLVLFLEIDETTAAELVGSEREPLGSIEPAPDDSDEEDVEEGEDDGEIDEQDEDEGDADDNDEAEEKLRKIASGLYETLDAFEESIRYAVNPRLASSFSEPPA